MRITDEQVQAFHDEGFVIIERFIGEEERLNALDGFHALFAPTYDDWLAAGKVNNLPKRQLFPWDHSGLNAIPAHPDVIDAAERIIGTREVRLSDCELSILYANAPLEDWRVSFGFHTDTRGNTLGPYQPNDHTNLTFFFNFEDVKEGMGPTLLAPTGKKDEEAVKMIAPGGSVVIYSSLSTRHSASRFSAPSGHRANMFVGYTRKDRPWDGGRTFTRKGGCDPTGLTRFLGEATPRQREVLGFPPPGDPLWTEEFLEGMIDIYPAFDPAPYRTARV